jgi:hypothetical protein
VIFGIRLSFTVQEFALNILDIWIYMTYMSMQTTLDGLHATNCMETDWLATILFSLHAGIWMSGCWLTVCLAFMWASGCMHADWLFVWLACKHLDVCMQTDWLATVLDVIHVNNQMSECRMAMAYWLLFWMAACKQLDVCMQAGPSAQPAGFFLLGCSMNWMWDSWTAWERRSQCSRVSAPLNSGGLAWYI